MRATRSNLTWCRSHLIVWQKSRKARLVTREAREASSYAWTLSRPRSKAQESCAQTFKKACPIHLQEAKTIVQTKCQNIAKRSFSISKICKVEAKATFTTSRHSSRRGHSSPPSSRTWTWNRSPRAKWAALRTRQQLTGCQREQAVTPCLIVGIGVVCD